MPSGVELETLEVELEPGQLNMDRACQQVGCSALYRVMEVLEPSSKPKGIDYLASHLTSSEMGVFVEPVPYFDRSNNSRRALVMRFRQPPPNSR
jgi:hypothetical protein